MVSDSLALHPIDASPPLPAPRANGGSLVDSLGGALATDAGVEAKGDRNQALGDAGPDGGAPLDAAAAAETCAGQAIRYEGICWHLARRDTSCEQSCAARGGFEPQSVAWLGTSEQGGAPSHCGEVLVRLGRSAQLSELGEPRLGQREDGVGAGCHLFGEQQLAWWLSAPPHTATARLSNARLVCGCRA